MDALGIDIGSTNVKVVRWSGGRAAGSAQRPLTWHRAGEVAEQDPDAQWDAVVGALDDLAADVGADAMAQVGTVGLCGQYSSIVPVDADVRPVAPMRLYLDQRGSGRCHDILGAHAEAFATWLERHPIPPVGGGLSLGHILSFQLDEPHVHERTAAYLEPVDHIAARLTGTIAATQASMFTSQLVDNRTLAATAYDPELVAMAGVDASRLPPLVAPGAVQGTVLAELASRWGLGPDVEVRAGMTDSGAQALATGSDLVGRVGVAIGTTGVVLSSVAELGIDLDHEVLAMPGVRPDRYLVSAENGIAGRAVEHVLGRVLSPSEGGGDPFAGFDEALASSPPGARDVLFLPFLSGSLAPQSDPGMRGAFVGLSLDAERCDLVRAAAEGVAHNLRWLLGPVEAFTGEQAAEVVLTGGAARSPGWCQALADVLGRPLHALADPGHSGALAVARWASALTAGEPLDPEASLPLGATYEPAADAGEVHDVAHARFVAAFEALRPLSAIGASA